MVSGKSLGVLGASLGVSGRPPGEVPKRVKKRSQHENDENHIFDHLVMQNAGFLRLEMAESA